MQVTIEEAQGAQSDKKILLLKEILSDGTEDLIEIVTDNPDFDRFEYKI